MLLKYGILIKIRFIRNLILRSHFTIFTESEINLRLKQLIIFIETVKLQLNDL